MYLPHCPLGSNKETQDRRHVGGMVVHCRPFSHKLKTMDNRLRRRRCAVTVDHPAPSTSLKIPTTSSHGGTHTSSCFGPLFPFSCSFQSALFSVSRSHAFCFPSPAQQCRCPESVRLRALIQAVCDNVDVFLSQQSLLSPSLAISAV